MSRRVLWLAALLSGIAILSGCGNGIGKLPGASSGNLTVQLTQGPPAPTVGGQPIGLVANVLNDTKNGGVTWSCTPIGACGTFNPTTTAYSITTLYTPPIAPPNGPITANLAYPVTITATSVSDNSQSVSTTLNIAQEYAFLIESIGNNCCGTQSYSLVGNVILDGSGNLTGETDFSQDNFTYGTPAKLTGTYSLDANGHGTITWAIAGCCGQTNSITATSNSHLLIAETDEFSGLNIGGFGTLDLQTAGSNLPLSALSGGYSFTLSGSVAGQNANASWAGIFSADGSGNITNGVFDENVAGGSGFASVTFTGTYTAPDANGRGILTLSATPDTQGKSTQYAYYMVTPEALRLIAITNAGNASNSGSAFGQGTVAGTNAALNGSYILGSFGFDANDIGANESAVVAAGQFAADGSGNIASGVMDVNDAGAVTTLVPWAGSSYAISGSPRGTIVGPSGLTYKVYLTDPNLNLLDPNNPSGSGGAVLLETDSSFDAVGMLLPQADPVSATLQGDYGLALVDSDNPPNFDGAYIGQFSATSGGGSGTFSGEGEFDTKSANGPLSGTFAADSGNPGRYTGAITTTPAYPLGSPTGTTAGTQNVSYYMANGSQGFIVETDSLAPIFGVVEAQGAISSAARARQRSLHQPHSSNASTRHVSGKQLEISRRTR